MSLWTPAYMATLLWLDAADAATLTLAGSLVTQWADKSGHNRHAAQATTAKQPSLTSGKVLFDGTDDALTLAAGIAITTDMTVAIVFTRPSASIFSQPMGTSIAGGTPYPLQWANNNVSYAALGSSYTTHGSSSATTGTLMVTVSRTSTQQIMHRNGAILGTAQTAPGATANTLDVIGGRGATYHQGAIAEIIVCSTSSDVSILEGYLAWKWGLQASLPTDHPYYANAPQLGVDAVMAGLVGQYGDASAIAAAMIGQYSMVLESALVGRYGDAIKVSTGLIGRYGNSAAVQSALIGRYGDLALVIAGLEGRYHLMHSAVAALDGRYAICGASVLSGLDGRYDLRDRNEIVAALTGYYSLLPGATIQQIVCPVRIGGASVRWSSVSWTLSDDSYLVEATIVLRDPAEFSAIAKHDTVEIDWDGVTYAMFVAAKLRSRSVSGDAGSAEYGADYTIIARSLTAALDAPIALPVTMSWPTTTLASTIAADLIGLLADLITLDWSLEDWLQPGGTFFLTDESPLEGLRKLAAIIGGIVQTSPDNAVIMRMAETIPPAEWATVLPAWTIEDSGLFSDSESEQQSNRYNVITVSNQGESDRSTRFVVEDLADYRKQVKGYRVPWADFGLATSGGDWVTIEDGGVVEELVVDEVVEFIDGSATSALPVYSQVSAVWLQAQLGAITAAEDGSLVAEIPSHSLARISYTTRCHVWFGTSDRDEEVQFYEVDA